MSVTGCSGCEQMYLQLATVDHITNDKDHSVTADGDEDSGLVEAVEHSFLGLVGVRLPTLDTDGDDVVEGCCCCINLSGFENDVPGLLSLRFRCDVLSQLHGDVDVGMNRSRNGERNDGRGDERSGERSDGRDDGRSGDRNDERSGGRGGGRNDGRRNGSCSRLPPLPLLLCSLNDLLSVLVNFRGGEVVVADEFWSVDGGTAGKPFQAAVAVER